MLIGEVARRSGVSARMLRHYESLGLVRPTGRTSGGYREYSETDIRRIFHVESLRSLGLSLAEAGRALDDPGFAPATLIEDLLRRTRERIAAETELLTRLRRVGEIGEDGDWEDVLDVVALLQGLGADSAGRRQRAALAADGRVPADTLAEAVLDEPDVHVGGALRWALARSGAAPERLAEGLDSPDPRVRDRAVRALADLPDAVDLLRGALTDPDPAVRGRAAVALGARGVPEAVPALLEVVVRTPVPEQRDSACRAAAEPTDATNATDATGPTGPTDVEAADALAVVAGDPAQDDHIGTAIGDLLATADAGARGRLAQALAEIPGPAADRALADLARDQEPTVAHTATYVQTLRG